MTAPAMKGAAATTGTRLGILGWRRSSVDAGAGHEDDGRGGFWDVVSGAEFFGVAAAGAGFQDRVADEVGVQVVRGEEGGLEGQEAQQFVPEAGEFFDALLAPGPDLGGDVVDFFDFLVPAQGVQDSEAEAGAVDREEEIGGLGFDGGDGLVEAAVEGEEAGEDFGEAHDGEFLHGEDGF